MENGKVFSTKKNSQITPSSLEEDFVIFKTEYAEVNPFCCTYLKKGVCCVVIECGLSKHSFDEKSGELSPLTDGIEWCRVRAITDEPDPQYDEGFVKSTDLELDTF